MLLQGQTTLICMTAFSHYDEDVFAALDHFQEVEDTDEYGMIVRYGHWTKFLNVEKD